jgi:hypothetical protein
MLLPGRGEKVKGHYYAACKGARTTLYYPKNGFKIAALLSCKKMTYHPGSDGPWVGRRGLNSGDDLFLLLKPKASTFKKLWILFGFCVTGFKTMLNFFAIPLDPGNGEIVTGPLMDRCGFFVSCPGKGDHNEVD